MIRVAEPVTSYVGRWTMREHRAEIFHRFYCRQLSKIWRLTDRPSPWLTIKASDLKKHPLQDQLWENI